MLYSLPGESPPSSSALRRCSVLQKGLDYIIKLERAVIVEGKYDKIRLSSLIDALIIETNGFGIFSDRERLDYIAKVAANQGIIILADSDSAGFKIRGYLSGHIPREQIIHAYIPDYYGKERRKEKPSSEMKLGVEAMSSEALIEALRRAGALDEPSGNAVITRKITAADLFEDGITGGENSAPRRAQLKKHLGLPERISTSALLRTLNSFLSFEEYKKVILNVIIYKGNDENGQEENCNYNRSGTGGADGGV